MGDKVVVGPINNGFRTNRTAFVIDNDSFPTLINAYQWRGRVKRKRGTTLLARLQRYFNSLSSSYSNTTTITLVGPPAGTGTGNLLTAFSLQTNGNIVPTTVKIQGVFLYEDPMGDGILYVGPVPGFGTVNYATGAISILGEGGNAVSATFNYYPDLPVMGLQDLILGPTETTFQFPGTLAFDTKYSYNIPTNVFPYVPYDVSFYKNPIADGTNLPGYTPKTTWTPTTWNGFDYQQFWTTNYQGALWATNGLDLSPTTLSNIQMQYAPAADIVYVSNTVNTITVTIAGSPLVVGDFVFFNEWLIGANPATDLNFQSGYVISIAAPNITIELPFATLTGPYIPGIIQYLTNRSDVTKDCIRWYDGDPTNGNPTNPTFLEGKGWVNFCPPLSQFAFSINDAPPRQYYLAGARMILPFQDRLLFFGVVIQDSLNTKIYLQDTIVFSQNGTPYYTASFTGDVLAATTVFHPILVPINQTATAPAYFVTPTGFGGDVSAGIPQPITTVGSNQDVLVIGFSNLQSKLVPTGDGIDPFRFYFTNSDLGSGSTFSSIDMNEGIISRGSRGYIITDQVGADRIDLLNPDQVFEMKLRNNGSERFCAQRDYINEWIYFTYPANIFDGIFPNQTFFYNYRDNSWSIFNECYTTYGQFRPSEGLTWNTAPAWDDWNDPWNSGSNTLLQTQVIAGNQQGFILFREDEKTSEEESLYIQSFSGNVITSPNHGLNNNDYIIINGAIGTVSSLVNGVIFQVLTTTTNTFTVNSPPVITGTYFGGGTIIRMYVPLIQTRQFPVNWGFARKTRLGPQQYLLTKTDDAQVQLVIFLSQNGTNPYNTGGIIPSATMNGSLIYSTVLYTCPESTNLGLTPANTNLQMVTATQQSQIWHRMNTSLLGDTVQIGFTLSDSQMRTLSESGKFISQFAEIELHGFILDCSPSQLLA